ncbi:uncharacterized protein LOC105201871 [Solenopsis invicta]|uniref:uncharacterized protein LOC105201871 n=1 Tax=Solenopsis invicta TaxID=13686 RepID=UPI00193D78C4|nr:uncharacterized protein LOC105201871 [Solenopsis invicta]
MRRGDNGRRRLRTATSHLVFTPTRYADTTTTSLNDSFYFPLNVKRDAVKTGSTVQHVCRLTSVESYKAKNKKGQKRQREKRRGPFKYIGESLEYSIRKEVKHLQYFNSPLRSPFMGQWRF